MRFDLDDAYKHKNRPFHSATPLFYTRNLLLFRNYFFRTVEDGLDKYTYLKHYLQLISFPQLQSRQCKKEMDEENLAAVVFCNSPAGLIM